LELLNGQFFLAPISATPRRILDLGIGIGSWAINVADTYPDATVIAIDLAVIQPKFISPNYHFQIGDVEDPRRFGEKIFDFIYARDLIQSIRDWSKVVDQA
jgi:ubiquinone/menaquinone biosynthesis C-methylase UbiE